MKKQIFTLVSCVIAFVFWFFESALHYFVFGEAAFEYIPIDHNELWMRIVIVILIVSFGVFTSFFSRKLLIQEKQLEAVRIYNSMLSASHHILNNLLNQMQLFRIEALKSKDFDHKIIRYFDDATNEATELIKKLSAIENITDNNIRAAVDPNKSGLSSDKTNPADAESGAAD